ncbi:hypothetical protein ACP70R_011056 [Stipagrostis hirtigluma subsp. patula]
MEKEAAESKIADEREEAASSASASRKRTRAAIDGAAGLCDDVVGNILARLPARAAVASMALSKRHRLLVRSPEFRSLHCRVSPPLPRPHIAYATTAPIRRGGERGCVSRFHGFHVAGAGHTGAAPIGVLAGARYLKKKYVNTCNGVVLLTTDAKPRVTSPPTCVLWNPAVAGDDKEVTVPDALERDNYTILGLGYGPRSKTYKLLLSRRRKLEGTLQLQGDKPKNKYTKELLVYTLGAAGEPMRLLTVLPAGLSGRNNPESLYMDGTIYLLHANGPARVLAFSVDDETVTTIDTPSQHDPHWPWPRSKLMEMYGRLCIAMSHDHHRVALWLLSADNQWEQGHVIRFKGDIAEDEYRDRSTIHGVWDCGGVLVMYINFSTDDGGKLCLYHVACNKMFKANLLDDLAPERSSYAFCWGYKPTLVSPGSIVAEPNQDEERHEDRTVDIMKALKPINEEDRNEGKRETLATVCFMEFLLRIMQKLPDNMQDVVEMPMIDSGGAGFFFETLE